MTAEDLPEIENKLAILRRKRGSSAAALAKAVGISRQTVYAIEAGTYVPNTAVALRLARTLHATVEDLFALTSSPPDSSCTVVEILPGSPTPHAGQPVQLCRVDQRLIASPPSAVPWYLPASDAVVVSKPVSRGNVRSKPKVQLLNSEEDASSNFENRLIVGGCDPGISVLARHVQAAGIRLVLAHRNSTQALLLLKEGAIHIAGTHLRDEASGESNIPEIMRVFTGNAVAVISFAGWEEGIVTARGNPKAIRGIEDFSRKDVCIVNRENGAGSRQLLDSHLERLKMDNKAVKGYEHLAPGHLPAAWAVSTGVADCCLATRAAARVFGLGFIPLVTERYDFAVRRQHLHLPAVQTVFDTLNRLKFRRELESIGGYDTTVSGDRIL